MLTSEAVSQYVSSVRGVRTALTRSVRSVWPQIPDNPDLAAPQLLAMGVTLVDTFGELVAVAAADFYDEVRNDGGYAAVLAPALPDEQIEAAARWAARPLFGAEPDRAASLSRFVSITDRLATNRGHETIYESGVGDPNEPRFARVPVGDTCAWCRLLASRGAVYRTRATAQFRRSHDGCDCKVVPVFDGDELPYDRQALYDEYRAARAEAGSGNVTDITAVMRAGSNAG